ncbi:hypothetical protein NHX12_030627, partial [Muraenolepis orangiensis]
GYMTTGTDITRSSGPCPQVPPTTITKAGLWNAHMMRHRGGRGLLYWTGEEGGGEREEEREGEREEEGEERGRKKGEEEREEEGEETG